MKHTITMLFNGTGEGAKPLQYGDTLVYSLANLLDRQTLGSHVFPGVGTIHPIRGFLFGTGIDAQCAQALAKIQPLLIAQHQVILNLYGHSRGAISALLLAKKLSHIDPQQLEINIAMHDPVPGNFVISSQFDFMHLTLAQQAMRLKQCRPLKKVLSLYTNQPFPWYDVIGHAHAPLFPEYPSHTRVTEQIIPGCHSNAQLFQIQNQQLLIGDPGSLISYAAIARFLEETGTRFMSKPATYYFHNNLSIEITASNQQDILAQAYDHAHEGIKTSFKRLGHNSRHISTNPEAAFFNPEHQRLKGHRGANQVQCQIQQTASTHLITSLAAITMASILFVATNLGVFASIIIGMALFLAVETAYKLRIEQEVPRTSMISA